MYHQPTSITYAEIVKDKFFFSNQLILLLSGHLETLDQYHVTYPRMAEYLGCRNHGDLS